MLICLSGRSNEGRGVYEAVGVAAGLVLPTMPTIDYGNRVAVFIVEMNALES
jgi:hypothetical protein